MDSKTSKTLYAYWNEVRGKRIAPRRFEIEPARIGSVLPETFILERVDIGHHRCRLAGTRIVETFGLEMRGANFLDLWSDTDQVLVNALLNGVSAQGGAGVLTFDACDGQDRRATFEALLLPLVHTTHVIDRIVGAISCQGAPNWLGTTRLGQRRLLTHKIVWPDGRPHAVVTRGEVQAPFLPHTRDARLVRTDRRQFRVYEGGLSKTDRDDR